MKGNPYKTYKEQSVMTMTPGEMLVFVYDGLLKHLNFAKFAFENKDMVAINDQLQRCQSIVIYLNNTLDTKYDVAKNLEQLYDFFLRSLIDANVKKDPKDLDAIIDMVKGLRDTYAQADKKVRQAEAAIS